MTEVLVTGGTGVLGREVVPALRAAGHQVRVLSRTAGADRVVGDLASGAGLASALTGVEVVLHLASAPFGTTWAVDVGGTRRLVVAAREAGARHVVSVSIPGVDRVPYSYYRAKFAAEEVVAAAGLPYSVVRATQFHPFVAALFTRAHRAGLLPVARGWPVQPVDAGDVARHLVERVAAGPVDGVVEFGGPEVREAADLARAWLAARGGRGRVVEVPVPGRLSGIVRSGALVPDPGAPRGTVPWAEWLARTGGESPYPT